jgi:nicotinate phosphoribosyltransferase
MAFNRFKNEHCVFDFKLRNHAEWTQEMVDDIRKQVDHLCTLKHTSDEIGFLASQKELVGKHEFFKFLEDFQLDRAAIDISFVNNELKIRVIGKWHKTIYFEVPVLAIVNEVYFRHNRPDVKDSDAFSILEAKACLVDMFEIPISDFGTRRRFNYGMQEQVVSILKRCATFKGTSNVHFAMKYGLKPVGTMSHQSIMVGAGLKHISLRHSQEYMLQQFEEEFRGTGAVIALSDTYGFDAFLRDFSGGLAKAYDGMRHDSGDPFEWAERAIQFYKDEGIDPKTKILVFSDGLTIKKCIELYLRFKDQINIAFGVGTHLTNDIPGVTALQIVMKIVQVNGLKVSKESDNPAKSMCLCPITKAYIRMIFGLSQ